MVVLITFLSIGLFYCVCFFIATLGQIIFPPIQDGFTETLLIFGIAALVLLILLVLCSIKYFSREYQARLKEKKRIEKEQTRIAKEKYAKIQAEALERKKRKAQIKAIREEPYRRRTTIVATYFIDGGGKRKSDTIKKVTRGVTGGLIGGVLGAALGISTVRDKIVRRFLVKYLDGHTEEEVATVGSWRYKELIKYLVTEE